MLWQAQTGAGVNAPASVFEHRGQQYVVVVSAGSLFANASRGDSVWLFSLQAKMDAVQNAIAVLSVVGRRAPPWRFALAAPGAWHVPLE